MKNFNIVRLDSKGRIIIPYHIRELLDIEEGSEFVILSHTTGEIKMLPLIKGKTAEINMHLEDSPGTLSKITEILAKNKINIIMSQSKVLEKGHLAEWHSIIDVSETKDMKKFHADLSGCKTVKKFEVRER